MVNPGLIAHWFVNPRRPNTSAAPYLLLVADDVTGGGVEALLEQITMNFKIVDDQIESSILAQQN